MSGILGVFYLSHLSFQLYEVDKTIPFYKYKIEAQRDEVFILGQLVTQLESQLRSDSQSQAPQTGRTKNKYVSRNEESGKLKG